MENTEAILLDLKEQALTATKNRDADFYREYLADDAIAVVPFGVFGKEAIVSQMAESKPAFLSSSIEDTHVRVLTPESGIVTYKATYEAPPGEGRETVSVFVTTIYAKVGGQWKGVFYQQTPMQVD